MEAGGSRPVAIVDGIGIDLMAQVAQALVELTRLATPGHLRDRIIDRDEVVAQGGVPPAQSGKGIDVLRGDLAPAPGAAYAREVGDECTAVDHRAGGLEGVVAAALDPADGTACAVVGPFVGRGEALADGRARGFELAGEPAQSDELLTQAGRHHRIHRDIRERGGGFLHQGDRMRQRDVGVEVEQSGHGAPGKRANEGGTPHIAHRPRRGTRREARPASSLFPWEPRFLSPTESADESNVCSNSASYPAGCQDLTRGSTHGVSRPGVVARGRRSCHHPGPRATPTPRAEPPSPAPRARAP